MGPMLFNERPDAGSEFRAFIVAWGIFTQTECHITLHWRLHDAGAYLKKKKIGAVHRRKLLDPSE